MSPAGLRFNWDEARYVHSYVTVCMCMCAFIKKDWIFRQIHREIQGSYRHLRNFLLLLLLLLFKKTAYTSVRSLISFCYCTCGNLNMLWSCRSTNPHSEVFLTAGFYFLSHCCCPRTVIHPFSITCPCLQKVCCISLCTSRKCTV